MRASAGKGAASKVRKELADSAIGFVREIAKLPCQPTNPRTPEPCGQCVTCRARAVLGMKHRNE